MSSSSTRRKPSSSSKKIPIQPHISDENFPPPNEQHNNYETILNEETKIGEIEYTKNLIKALKEAIDENDRLRESAAQLVEENNKMRNELDEKDNIIRELGEYYQFCQENHLGKTPLRNIKKEEKSPVKKRKKK